MKRLFILLPLILATLVACSPTSPSTDFLTLPVMIEEVIVRQNNATPPDVRLRVKGIIGACDTVLPYNITKQGNEIEVSVMLKRLAIDCRAIGICYRATIPIGDDFAPGSYIVRVNGVAADFTIE